MFNRERSVFPMPAVVSRDAYDWLIVGAGFTGAIAAERIARVHGLRVLLIESRDHIGGNAHDRRNEDGILHHVYGPHIFHTNASQIVDYLSQFTAWRPYEHRVVAMIRNRLVPIPFNLTSIEMLFDHRKAQRMRDALVATYGFGASTTIMKLRAETSGLLRELADFIYDNVFVGYTRKQWGVSPEELDASVTDRVPVRVSYDDRYFQDSFQNIPMDGYTQMFRNILVHERIDVLLQTHWTDVFSQVKAKNILFTGAIDEFCDYVLGPLPYRSLSFDLQTYRQPLHQPVAQVNYPNAEDFTRITEMSYLTGEKTDQTLVAIEYPKAHEPGATIPYYPIPRAENQELHREYLRIAAARFPHVYFAGRLADYRYYNMDQAAGRALSFVRKLAAEK
jgi:UDP-galactopyranose mutase